MVKGRITDTLLPLVVFMLTAFVVGCKTTHSQPRDLKVPSRSALATHEAYLARVQAVNAFPDTLAGAAHQTYASHVRAINAGETDPSDTIPAVYWAERIKQLKPLRVYKHRVNIVVVQEESESVEKGKYIYIPVSSYFPMTGDDGFVFKPNPKKGKVYQCHEVLDFTRMTGN